MSSSTWDTQNLVLQELLRDVRKNSELTQLELASLLNRPQSYVSKYESGERRLDLLEIRNIANCCGLKLQEFTVELETRLLK
jgi:transcriptional regulator with XRE-family HTH domain